MNFKKGFTLLHSTIQDQTTIDHNTALQYEWYKYKVWTWESNLPLCLFKTKLLLTTILHFSMNGTSTRCRHGRATYLCAYFRCIIIIEHYHTWSCFGHAHNHKFSRVASERVKHRLLFSLIPLFESFFALPSLLYLS